MGDEVNVENKSLRLQNRELLRLVKEARDISKRLAGDSLSRSEIRDLQAARKHVQQKAASLREAILEASGRSAPNSARPRVEDSAIGTPMSSRVTDHARKQRKSRSPELRLGAVPSRPPPCPPALPPRDQLLPGALSRFEPPPGPVPGALGVVLEDPERMVPALPAAEHVKLKSDNKELRRLIKEARKARELAAGLPKTASHQERERAKGEVKAARRAVQMQAESMRGASSLFQLGDALGGAGELVEAL